MNKNQVINLFLFIHNTVVYAGYDPACINLHVRIFTFRGRELQSLNVECILFANYITIVLT